ncbi:MAG: RNA polymerase sigma factor, partial [Betaproteobacteria bacterium]|nr:RNA polymerase sigma factor [Betaproteobacteria bacterium]
SRAIPATVKRSNRSATVAKLSNQAPAAKKAAMKSEMSPKALPEQRRKVAAGGGDDWEEF